MENLKDLVAEKSVLAGVIQHGEEVYYDIKHVVKVSSFTEEDNIVLWTTLERLFDSSESVDYPTLCTNAPSLEMFSKYIPKEKYNKLRNTEISLKNTKLAAARVFKFEAAREAYAATVEMQRKLKSIEGKESVSEIVGLVEREAFSISDKLDDKLDSKPELIGDDVMEHIQHLRDNPSEMIGISSGFTRFDDAIGGGFRSGNVDLIAARTKVGKSMFADAVALHVAGVLKIPVLYLDTEMQKKDHQRRMLASLSNIKTKDIETSKFNESQGMNERIDKAGLKIKDMPYHFKNIAGKKFEETESLIRRWIIKDVGFNEQGETNPCLVIYDYFKLTTSSDMDNLKEFQALGYQMQDMVNLTIEYNFPCLSFVQTNRDGETKETLETISQSDRLSWFASSITIFKKKSSDEMAEDAGASGNRKLIPVASRYGGGLEDFDYINVNLFGDYSRVEEGLTKNELVLASKKQKEGFENTVGDEQQEFKPEKEIEDEGKPF
tara:strand:+ start:1859 stop:3337 length:1479 start_codon:yes stop_codon:yes gene_type:complete